MPFKIETKGFKECKNNFVLLSGSIPNSVALKGSAASGPVIKGMAQGYIAGETAVDEFQQQAFTTNGVTYLGHNSLHNRRATLKLSIGWALDNTDGNIGVAVGTNSVYGRIHEMGGVIKPVAKRFLHFVVDGEHVFTKQVTMPARPFLLAGLLKSKEIIMKLFTKAFWREVKNDTKI